LLNSLSRDRERRRRHGRRAPGGNRGSDGGFAAGGVQKITRDVVFKEYGSSYSSETNSKGDMMLECFPGRKRVKRRAELAEIAAGESELGEPRGAKPRASEKRKVT